MTKKNPVYFNAAVRLFKDESYYSCNVVVNEVIGRLPCYYSDNIHYKLPEVVAYKRMLGIRSNNSLKFKDSFFDDIYNYDKSVNTFYRVRDRERTIRIFALLLAYESGVGSDLIDTV